MRDNKTPFFIINLPQSVDRKIYMQEQCKNLDINPTFIEAVYGKNLSQDEINKYCDQEKAKFIFGRELMLGEIGCALSHKKIYQKMVDENIEYAVILEDDIYFKDSILEVINSIGKYPKKWELILLGHYSECINGEEVKSNLSYWGKFSLNSKFLLYRLAGFGYGTHGYLINQKGAKKLLTLLDRISRPMDHYTADSSIVNVYALDPVVVRVQQDFGTLIDTSNVRITDVKPKLHRILEIFGLLGAARKINIFRKRIMPVKIYR